MMLCTYFNKLHCKHNDKFISRSRQKIVFTYVQMCVCSVIFSRRWHLHWVFTDVYWMIAKYFVVVMLCVYLMCIPSYVMQIYVKAYNLWHMHAAISRQLVWMSISFLTWHVKYYTYIHIYICKLVLPHYESHMYR